MIVMVIAAFISTVTLGILLEVPKRFIIRVGVVGAIGWLIYLAMGTNESSVVFRSFVATLVVATVSHSFARIMKAPVTVFLISGILPLVPGTGMYYTVYHLIIGNRSMAGFYLVRTMEIAGVIALGIFIIDSIFRLYPPKFQRNLRGNTRKRT